MSSSSESLQSRNKALVLKALHELFNLHDITALDRYWSPNYIQHNPTFGDGPAGLKTLVTTNPNIRHESGMIVAEGDYVMTHSRYTGAAGEPALIAADIFIVKDGRLIEHWDVIQPEQEPNQHKHPMWPTPHVLLTPTRINVMVVGYGVVGHEIITGLTSPAYQQRIRAFLLVRPNSNLDPKKKALLDAYVEKGVTVLEADLSGDSASLTNLIADAHIHTVVSTVGFGQYMDQLPLITAADRAGVHRFFPSEYGFEHTLVASGTPLAGVFDLKQAVQAAVKKSRMAWTMVYTGGFTEFLLDGDTFGFNKGTRTLTAPVSWERVIEFTSLKDIAALVPHAILNPATENTSIYLGERLTYGEIADTLDRVTGVPVKRRVTTREEAAKRIEANPQDFPARFVSVIDAQRGTSWPTEQTYVAKYAKDYAVTTLASIVKQRL